jgi:hypothetical protein
MIQISIGGWKTVRQEGSHLIQFGESAGVISGILRMLSFLGSTTLVSQKVIEPRDSGDAKYAQPLHPERA